jgi:hypothetical protein
VRKLGEWLFRRHKKEAEISFGQGVNIIDETFSTKETKNITQKG